MERKKHKKKKITRIEKYDYNVVTRLFQTSFCRKNKSERLNRVKLCVGSKVNEKLFTPTVVRKCGGDEKQGSQG